MGMESLMQEIVAEGKGKKAREEGGERAGTEEARQAKIFKAAWEAMLVEGMNGPDGEELAELLASAGGGEAPGARDGKSTAEGAGGFQDKIKQAMDKLKESETNLQVRFPYLICYVKYWRLAHGWSGRLKYCGCHIPGITRGAAQITRRRRAWRGRRRERARWVP